MRLSSLLQQALTALNRTAATPDLSPASDLQHTTTAGAQLLTPEAKTAQHAALILQQASSLLAHSMVVQRHNQLLHELLEHEGTAGGSQHGDHAHSTGSACVFSDGPSMQPCTVPDIADDSCDGTHIMRGSSSCMELVRQLRCLVQDAMLAQQKQEQQSSPPASLVGEQLAAMLRLMASSLDAPSEHTNENPTQSHAENAALTAASSEQQQQQQGAADQQAGAVPCSCLQPSLQDAAHALFEYGQLGMAGLAHGVESCPVLILMLPMLVWMYNMLQGVGLVQQASSLAGPAGQAHSGEPEQSLQRLQTHKGLQQHEAMLLQLLGQHQQELLKLLAPSSAHAASFDMANPAACNASSHAGTHAAPFSTGHAAACSDRSQEGTHAKSAGHAGSAEQEPCAASRGFRTSEEDIAAFDQFRDQPGGRAAGAADKGAAGVGAWAGQGTSRSKGGTTADSCQSSRLDAESHGGGISLPSDSGLMDQLVQAAQMASRVRARAELQSQAWQQLQSSFPSGPPQQPTATPDRRRHSRYSVSAGGASSQQEAVLHTDSMKEEAWELAAVVRAPSAHQAEAAAAAAASLQRAPSHQAAGTPGGARASLLQLQQHLNTAHQERLQEVEEEHTRVLEALSQSHQAQLSRLQFQLHEQQEEAQALRRQLAKLQLEGKHA